MQSANQKPGKLDTLSQHAVETNHRSGKLDMLSQHTLQKLTCIKEAAKAQNSGQASCTTRRPEQEEQQSKQLHHLRRVGKRCEK